MSFPWERCLPSEVYEGVVAGIADYGNKMGIPTVNGATLFDQGYVANPLVFCGTVGLAPRGRRPTEPRVGDLIVMAGGRVGRDGIHGATFSSDVLGLSHAELGSVVQIGDPIVEKRLADALPQARDLELYSAITDCGAGGLSSAVGEMASQLGAEVELAHVPLKYDGLRPWEIWLSEAQERMVLAVPPEHWSTLQDVFAAEGVEATAIGRFTGDGRLRVHYDGKEVADLDCSFLHNGMPLRHLDSVWTGPPSSDPAPALDADVDFTMLLQRALADANVASKEPIVRQYDHEVQGRTVGKPFVGPEDAGPADAAVLRPVAHSWRGLAIGCGINPWYGELDPYAMALLSVDEALRNIVAVGGDPAQTAILDNFCWGNPNIPDRLGGLVRAAQGCHDAAVCFRVPFISGKDSLFNEYRLADGTSHPIPGTLLISAIGIVPDIRRAMSMHLKQPGNLVYLIGVTGDDLGGSLVLRLHRRSGTRPPAWRPSSARSVLRSVHKAIRKGVVQACHDLCEGGLAVAAAEMAIAGGHGMEIDLGDVPVAESDLSDATRLFAESPTRFLVEVAPDDAQALETVLGRAPHARIGRVLAEPRYRVNDNRGPVIDRTCRNPPRILAVTTGQVHGMSTVATRRRTMTSRARTRPKALVIRAPGTNCDRETGIALELAGAAIESMHLEQVLVEMRGLDDFAMVVLPGGFSFGDHLGAGALWAHRLEAMRDSLSRFVESGRPVLGICNGFQALMRLGLLDGGGLAPNASGRFECRWIWMERPQNVQTPLLDGIDRIAMPIAHGEGRFVAKDAVTLRGLQARGEVGFTYCDANGQPGGYPVNPNGSDGAVAALTNAAGNVLGLMPHPERNVSAGQAPAGRLDGAGLTIFTNAVRMAGD